MPKTATAKIPAPAPGTELPTTQVLQISIPFAASMLLNKLVLKRLGEGVRSSLASKGTFIAEAIVKLAQSEGITYTPGEK